MGRMYLEEQVRDKICKKFEETFQKGGLAEVENLLGTMGESTRAKYKLWEELLENKRKTAGNTISVQHLAEIPDTYMANPGHIEPKIEEKPKYIKKIEKKLDETDKV